MFYMSKSTSYHRNNKDDRDAWSERFDACWLCGAKANWLELQTHEMVSKAKFRNAWAMPCNYMRLCQLCHSERIPFMSLAEQLAVKLRHDPLAYCVEPLRELASQVNGRETMLVYDWEIIEAVRQLIIRGEICQR